MLSPSNSSWVKLSGCSLRLRKLDLRGSVPLQITLVIARQQFQVSVPGQSLKFANSDPVYRQLRELGLGRTFRFDNFTVPCDAGTFQFRKGTLTMLDPVNGVVTGAIFIGEGHFNLKPVTPIDARDLSRRTGAAEVDEDFTEVVFRFTGEGRMKFLPGLGDRIWRCHCGRADRDHGGRPRATASALL